MSTTTNRHHQRMAAMDKANEIRLGRAALRRRIARGEVPVIEVITHPPAEAKTWPVAGLLACQRGWSTIRTRKFLNRVAVPESKPVGALAQSQLGRIVRGLKGVDEGEGS